MRRSPEVRSKHKYKDKGSVTSRLNDIKRERAEIKKELAKIVHNKKIKQHNYKQKEKGKFKQRLQISFNKH